MNITDNLIMLPEFLYTVDHSMQDISRDDFSLLSGSAGNVVVGTAATNLTDTFSTIAHQKDMCLPLLARLNNATPPSAAAAANGNSLLKSIEIENARQQQQQQVSFNTIKIEDTSGSIDLFPTHPSTWQQHPMNNHELAHHRLTNGIHQQQQQQQHHHQHQLSHQFNRYNHHHHHNTNLLLQGSDDPLISHGANAQDDEHPADFAKTLMANSLREDQHQQQPPRHHHQQHCVSSKNQQEQSKLSHEISARIMQFETQQRPAKSGCSNLTKQQLKAKANLMSARNQQQRQQQQQQEKQQQQQQQQSQQTQPTAQTNKARASKLKKKSDKGSVKLRFHHQALPPEYLSHYEATQGKQRSQNKSQQTSKSSANTTQQRSAAGNKSSSNSQRPSYARNSHENVRSWLQKIAEIQRTANASKEAVEKANKATANSAQTEPTTAATRPDNEKTAMQTNSAQTNSSLHFDQNNNNLKRQNNASTTMSSQNGVQMISKSCNAATVLKLKDKYIPELPYMGEITLDNCKPRRGRKPKKADICHLIYKNYGTIFPKKNHTANVAELAALKHVTSAHEPTQEQPPEGEQPLNLCLRDHAPADSYSISSADDATETNSSCPTPITTPSDVLRDSLLATNLKNSLTNLNSDMTAEEQLAAKQKQEFSESTAESSLSSVHQQPAQIDPVTLYYQKLLESGVLLQHGNGSHYETIQQKDNQYALKIPIPSGLFELAQTSMLPALSTTSAAPASATSGQTLKLEKSLATSPAPSQCSTTMALEYPEPLSTPSSIKSENSLATNSNSSLIGQQLLAPQKRKRSAIFIPPVNTSLDTSASPATEVSICKFKFTGGAKPMLQEKKMLSVDAGGNYRYFSGTGDKSSRGYEYFPRESLQQTAGLLPGVNCIGQKLCIDIPPPSAGLSHELLQLPESPTSSMLLSSTAASPKYSAAAISAMETNKTALYSNSTTAEHSSILCSTLSTAAVAQRKKFSPLTQQQSDKFPADLPSTQREKLEKTFKEQGFLIQTQQLEAEGATYYDLQQEQQQQQQQQQQQHHQHEQQSEHVKIAAEHRKEEYMCGLTVQANTAQTLPAMESMTTAATTTTTTTAFCNDNHV